MSNANAIQIGGTHYSGGSYQHWDLSTDLRLRHLEGAATKYLSRFGNKAGESAYKDLSKTRHYVVKLIEVYNEGRISTQNANLGHHLVDEIRVNASLTRFLSTLSGPPASQDAQSAITLLCTWKGTQDLSHALELIDLMLDEYNTDAPTSGETAHIKERNE